MALVIKAVFLGEHGSVGYLHGEIYTLTIHENMIVSPRKCPYGSMEAFLKNWAPVDDARIVSALGDKHLRKVNE